MIKLSFSIPDTVDTKDPVLNEFLIALKLCVEELASKGKQIQDTVNTAAPGITEFESEGQEIQAHVGANYLSYTLIDGAVKSATLT